MFCSIFPLNQKIISWKKLNLGFLSVPHLVPGLMFIINILGNIADQFCKIMWIILQIYNYGYRQWVTYSGVREGGGGDYSRETIILNVSVRGGLLLFLWPNIMGKHFFRLRMGKAQAQREAYFSKTDFSRLFGYKVFSYGSVNPCLRIFLDNFNLWPHSKLLLKPWEALLPHPTPAPMPSSPRPPLLHPLPPKHC